MFMEKEDKIHSRGCPMSVFIFPRKQVISNRGNAKNDVRANAEA